MLSRAVPDVPNSQPNEIARARFAIDIKIE